MIVLDASAAIDLLLRTSLGVALEPEVLSADESLHAPDILDLEVLGALRRRERRGELEHNRAVQALDDLRALPIGLHPSRPMLDRAWALRANLTAADALYTALAEALPGRLVTTDRRLAATVEGMTDVRLLAL